MADGWHDLVSIQGHDPAALADAFGSWRLVLWRPAWHKRAACRGVDTDLFFPERGGSLELARALCAGCPVRSECLTFALDGDEGGYWAGTSERERRRMRRARRAEAA